ncbi:MAG: hypothetical protein HYW90_04065, partial [Candidatus Sungbacteria bacterium]|nr:hypothetical protein [Candidatus Sungbacteria bacterium]
MEIKRNVNEYISLPQAESEFGISHDYLRLLIHRRKLRAVKVGRDWVTTRPWMHECTRRKKSRAEYIQVTPEVPAEATLIQHKAILARSVLNFSKISKWPLSRSKTIFLIFLILASIGELIFANVTSLKESYQFASIAERLGNLTISYRPPTPRQFAENLRKDLRDIFEKAEAPSPKAAVTALRDIFEKAADGLFGLAEPEEELRI